VLLGLGPFALVPVAAPGLLVLADEELRLARRPLPRAAALVGGLDLLLEALAQLGSV
jgi:hypothetical protein